MKQILFVHQNFPGQYRYLSRHYAAHPEWQAFAIGEKKNVKSQLHAVPKEGLTLLGYDNPPVAHPDSPWHTSTFEDQMHRGEFVATLALRQKKNGLNPDVICSHPGWGDSVFLKEVFPDAKLVNYFEYYYKSGGDFMHYDPEYVDDVSQRMRFHVRNAIHLLSLEMADAGVCPTKWQASTFPADFQNKIQVIHDGIDTDIVRPKSDVTITINGLPRGPIVLSEDTEIITFSVRNLEPHRGFDVFMRALPDIQKRRPNVIVVVVGGDNVSYGKKHHSGKTWREAMLDEVGDRLDMERVLFTGKLPYHTLLNLFRITSLHIYMTSPFVLSWSMMEAMACGAPMLASATPPVLEVIEDGKNGFLFDFYDTDRMVSLVDELLADPQRLKKAGQMARATIVEKYDLKTVCMPGHTSMIEALVK